ncbi:uncharacterized protein LOC110879830 isoform X2 [Helianthus annuus]|uniref:uncharacterized protein LOC110879830 isoform X2 n=1 Tax=Helianthus annuus TaxID=4232 RepID=UPI000B8FCF94|nr:uncharacterized protein LOC110879830 isoform X2 [Helianthus annuus]
MDHGTVSNGFVRVVCDIDVQRQVFVAGVMYFAMLLIGWNSHYTMKKWTIDVGWTSTWVRIVNEWLAVCVYYAGSTDRVEKSEGSRRSQISKLEGDNRHCVC